MKYKLSIIARKFFLYVLLFIFFRSVCIFHTFHYPEVRCFDDYNKPIKIDKDYLNIILSIINEDPRGYIKNQLNFNDYTKILLGIRYSDPSINILFEEDKIYVSFIGYESSFDVSYTLNDKMEVVDFKRIVRIY